MTTPPSSANLRSARSAAKRARKSSARAAAVTGSSARGIEMAKTVRKHAPDLMAEVMAGTRSLHSAYQETRRRVLAAVALGLDIDQGRIRAGRNDHTEPCPRCGGSGRVERGRSDD